MEAWSCSWCAVKHAVLCQSRCLKITEKVSFNIASEASYVYLLSGQKLIKNAKKGSILASFWKPESCGQTVLPDRSILIGQKMVENVKIQKLLCDILSNFQTMCRRREEQAGEWLLSQSCYCTFSSLQCSCSLAYPTICSWRSLKAKTKSRAKESRGSHRFWMWHFLPLFLIHSHRKHTMYHFDSFRSQDNFQTFIMVRLRQPQRARIDFQLHD